MKDRPHVLFGCNSRRVAASGMAGSLIAAGAALDRHGWRTSFVFSPDVARISERVERQLTYLRVARAVRRVRPDVAVISSADGVLVPRLAPSTAFVMQSHGLEHRHREALTAAGVDFGEFGWGHRHI